MISPLKYPGHTFSWLASALLVILLFGCGPEAPVTNTAEQNDAQEAPADLTEEAETDESSDGKSEESTSPDSGDNEASTQSADKAKEIDPEANAALWAASAQGQLTAVKDALKRGGSVHSRDENGNTALMLAAFDGHEAVVKLLIEKGAEVNALNPQGRSALMFAATFNDPETVKLLLANGAIVNAKDNVEKFTALMFAAAEGHYDVVKLLLDHEADKSLVDIDGDTAADFARNRDQAKVLELLE